MKYNSKIIHILILICVLFFSIVGYLTYFQVFQSGNFVNNPYNRRQYEAEEKTLRGNIYDRNGILLAFSEKSDNIQERIYPYGALYSHIIGYNSRVYGRSQLEALYNSYLLGIDEYSKVFGILESLDSTQKTGNDLYLTLDHKLQTLGEKLLRGKKGAIVAMNPRSGEILAMVSKPDFDPDSTKLAENWQDMVESEEYPFLPRATQGLYAPGSTFKVAITAVAIENGLMGVEFEDKGIVTIDGMEIKNYGGKAYGHLNIEKALGVSSNVAFSQLGVMLGRDNLKDIADRMGLGKDIPFDIPVSRSAFPYDSMDKVDMAAVGIGQGKVMVTPLHMSMIASCIANDGVMMKPSMIKQVSTSGGKEIKSFRPTELYSAIGTGTADIIKQMMRKVVDNGTGKNAAIKGVGVAGKTGTAENELTARKKNMEHAWFIGFSPVEDPRIAVAVILEHAGSSGGAAAAPIARDIIASYLDGLTAK